MAPAAREEFGDDRITRIAQADTERPWYKKPNLRFLYLILVPCGLGVEWTSGFDSSMMNSLQAVESWQEYFGHPGSSTLGLLNAMYSLGALMAIPFIPTVSQYLGRKRTICTGSIIMMIGAGMQTGSINQHMFLASRWLLGFGIPFAIVNASSLLSELGYERERPFLTSLFNASWFVGAIAAAGTTYGTFQMTSTWSWRIPSVLQLVPSLLNVSFIYWCPESPRWLISKDRSEEALTILEKYHSEGKDGDEYVRLEFARIQSTIQQEQELAKAFVWADVVRDAPMRRRFAIAGAMGFFTQWSGNGLLSFYMARILRLVGIENNRTIQQVILSNTCWGFINAVPLALIAPRFPRRLMFLISIGGCAIVYTSWTVASARFQIDQSQGSAIAVLFFIFAYSPLYNMGWNAMAYTYLTELFPYQQRAKGIAFEQLTVRFAVFFNTYVNPIALDAIQWRYYLVYCCWILVEWLVVFFFFPETHGRSLEELSFMFEGQEMRDKVDRNMDRTVDELAIQKAVEQETRKDILT